MHKKPNNTPILHVYGPESWHDTVYIMGNRQALCLLRSAIDKALTTNNLVTTNTVFHADGEGYDVVILPENSNWQNPVWQKMALPYVDDFSNEMQRPMIWPSQLVEYNMQNKKYERKTNA